MQAESGVIKKKTYKKRSSHAKKAVAPKAIATIARENEEAARLEAKIIRKLEDEERIKRIKREQEELDAKAKKDQEKHEQEQARKAAKWERKLEIKDIVANMYEELEFKEKYGIKDREVSKRLGGLMGFSVVFIIALLLSLYFETFNIFSSERLKEVCLQEVGGYDRPPEDCDDVGFQITSYVRIHLFQTFSLLVFIPIIYQTIKAIFDYSRAYQVYRRHWKENTFNFIKAEEGLITTEESSSSSDSKTDCSISSVE